LCSARQRVGADRRRARDRRDSRASGGTAVSLSRMNRIRPRLERNHCRSVQ
jgi:hypothetical protein